ncbi:MAG: hypothetical protein ACYC3G_00905 [Minisyncoccota bacterium]
MLKELNNELWRRIFKLAKAPFQRDGVKKVFLFGSPFDNDKMSIVGVFQLKDRSFATISANYSGTWDEVSQVEYKLGIRLKNPVSV